MIRRVQLALVPRLFSTVRTTRARAGPAPRQQIHKKRRRLEALPPANVEEIVQQNVHVQGRTTRYSLSDPRPGLFSHGAHQVTDPSISTRALSSFLRTKGSRADDRRQRVFYPPGTRHDKDIQHSNYKHDQKLRLSPLGTRPRAQPEDFESKGCLEEEPLQERTHDLDNQKKEYLKDTVPSSSVAEAGSHLPLTPDLWETIADNRELYGATPLEAAVFHSISSGRDVYIRQKTNATPAYLLPIVQKLVSNEDGRHESSIVASAPLLRHIPRTRPLSALVLLPQPQAADEISRMAKKLLRKYPQYSVCTAILGQRPSRIQCCILDGCDILVANPRVLADLLDQSDSHESIRGKLEGLHTVIVERANSLVNLRSMQHVQEILSQLSPNSEQTLRPQRVLVSATDPTGSVAELAGALLSQPYDYVDASGKRQAPGIHPKTKSHGPKGVEKHGDHGHLWTKDRRGHGPSRRNSVHKRVEVPQAKDLA